MSYIIHLVIQDGAPADDVYVGAFTTGERADLIASKIERNVEGVTPLVRFLEPGTINMEQLNRLVGN